MRCDAYVNEGSAPCIDGPLSLNMFDCTPRPWWKQDCPNKEYMHKHLSRHLRRAGLLRELGSTILDLRWISAQGRAGGILGLKNDLCVLESATTEEVVKAPIMRIAEVAISNSGSLHMGLRVLSHIFLAHLFRLGKTNEWIYRFLERLKDATPKPYLDAMVTFYEPRGDDLKFDIDYMPPSENGDAYLTTDFSTCDRYLAAGANRDVVVFSLDTQNRLKWCKGHEKDVSVVKFSSDASMIISGSLDNNVIVWDWQSSESPALTLRGHKGAVTSLSLSSDDCSIFSGSRDGTVKIWNICTGELCHEFEFADAVESVSASPISEIVAVGMRTGHLRCMNSASGDCLFEQNMLDVGLLSAVQFATDGKFLVCGSAKGKVASWRAVDWRKAASVYMPGSVANIAFHPDGTNVIVATSEGEIRNWNVAEEKLASYNIALARPVNGLSFRNCGKDVIVGTKLGYARAWSGSQSNPNLDFEDFRKNVLHDFTLSSDGTRVATSTHDSIIRIWNSDTGSEFSAYPAPEDGSRRLVLNGDGNKIASVSPNGIVQVWNADMPPGDGDISFTVDDKNVSCLSFSPDNIRLLVSLNDEVLVWNLDSRQELRRLPSFGCSESSFSADGRFIIVGNSMRTIIRDAMSSETVFDSSSISSQMMSFSEAENVTTTCGPSAHRMWPISIRNPAADLNSAHGVSSATELTAGNIFNFATYHFRAVDMLFCRDKFILNHYGVLGIYKLQK